MSELLYNKSKAVEELNKVAGGTTVSGCEISEAVVPSGKSYRQDYQPDCSFYRKYGSCRSQDLSG
mgnify:CR=1 FL=1